MSSLLPSAAEAVASPPASSPGSASTPVGTFHGRECSVIEGPSYGYGFAGCSWSLCPDDIDCYGNANP